ncbi:UPF0676 protein [Golovinomyces cichoracearum]|uniref:UPF0676 protein n=1 Tax=Golovinomyces cichoracearum TaxID=62708 RepID=A0A420HDE8_9PEZI|nr:UPF0676 protein [Golovinomyces cichoracearum]
MPPDKIPVIDLSSGTTEFQLAKQLVDAASSYGFAYIRNFQEFIPADAIEKLFELSRKFFAVPTEEKNLCRILENNRGWTAMHAETLDSKSQRTGDFKEAINIGHFIDGKPQQPIPNVFLGHEKDINQFQIFCQRLTLKLLTLFAQGLDIDEEAGGSDWFASRHREISPRDSILRLLHYPPITPGSDYQPNVDFRAGAHTDYGSLTLLFQKPGQPGLEILLPSHLDSNKESESSWDLLPIYPSGTEFDPCPPIVMNIGDLLSFWTNGVLKSTVHRVIVPQSDKENAQTRYSMAYFAHPIGSTYLEAVPSQIVRAHKVRISETSRQKPITANEHLMSRLRVTYREMD